MFQGFRGVVSTEPGKDCGLLEEASLHGRLGCPKIFLPGFQVHLSTGGGRASRGRTGFLGNTSEKETRH